MTGRWVSGCHAGLRIQSAGLRIHHWLPHFQHGNNRIGVPAVNMLISHARARPLAPSSPSSPSPSTLLTCPFAVSSAHDTFPPFCTTRTKDITTTMIGTFFLSPYTLLLLPFIYYLLPYIRNNAIRDIPGPTPAIFSNLWLLYQCRRGRRYLAVDQAHKTFGPLARIQPDHVSIADPEAIPVVYSHTGGWLKR